MAITFTKSTKVINITSPQTNVFIQDLINAIRDYEDNGENMELAKIANASGKQDLGGGVLVGITLELINDWRISFTGWSGPDTQGVSVGGGNLVATNQYDNNPILPTAFTQVAVQSSSSATISQLEIVNLQHMIESQRSHAGYGSVFYWDPANGADGLDGSSPENAVATWSRAEALCTDGSDDIVFLNSPGESETYVDEEVIFTKSNVHLRGPGLHMHLKPNGTPGPVVWFSGVKGSSIENVRVDADWITGVGWPFGEPKIGILAMNSDSCKISQVDVYRAGTFNVQLLGGDHHTLHRVRSEHSASHGIAIISSFTTPIDEVVVNECVVAHAGGDGYFISGSSFQPVEGVLYEGNTSYGCSGYGASIYQANNITADQMNYGHANTSGVLYIDPTCTNVGYALLDTIAQQSSGVWNTATSGNTAVGTFGEKVAEKLLTFIKFMGTK